MANIENTIAKFEADKQADFLNDKINREVKPCDDNDEVWELIPDVSELNDVEDAPTDEALDFDIEEWKAAFADYRAKKKRMQKEINQLKIRIAALPLPTNIKDSLKRAMQIALEKHRYYNSLRLQKEANAERECYLICKKALKVVA